MLDSIRRGKALFFPHFSSPVLGTLRGVLDNDITTRDKSHLNGLGMKKVESGGLSMMMKSGMEVYQYYTVFKYGPPRPQKELNSQDRTIVAGPLMKLASKLVTLGHSKEKVGK